MAFSLFGKKEREKEQNGIRPDLASGLSFTDEEYAKNEARKQLKAIEKGDTSSGIVDSEKLSKAMAILQKYKQGKANLDRRIIEGEEWYKLRHWECMRDKRQEVAPVSAWLFNAISNKHADAMDNFPEPSVLPREESDKAEAKALSSIIPVILDQCNFEQTYSDVSLYKLKTGTGVYGIFWDKNACKGLGNIVVRKINLLNLFFEPGVSDIQQSRNLFHCQLIDIETLKEQYPQLENVIGGRSFDVPKFLSDESIDTADKAIVVDWYYKKNINGRTVLHYCKFVNDCVLFSTENDPDYAQTGLYAHGKYPFVFDVLFPEQDSPCGFGYIDVGKDTQAYIDRADAAIQENLLQSASPRYFVREDAGINEDEFTDIKNKLVHYSGNDPGASPISTGGLAGIYYSVLQGKIDELKETTGNRDVSNGGTTGGVTAASGLAAMMEAGSKLSRASNKASYRAFREVVEMVIELIRQFYDLPRWFRILGERGTMEFIQYSNKNLLPQEQGNEFGVDMGARIPLFDVAISAAKQSPYSKLSQNELALQFYQAGFFNPAMAPQALMCLDMMDFDRKDFIMQKIAENSVLFQQSMALPPRSDVDIDSGIEEPAIVKNAKERTAEATSPT